ncbi:cell division protein FtsH, partial [Escherichia coli]|nr:cell division protein FtsH [Escherichia coli]
NMVTRWGLSPKLGTVAYSENQDEVFLGHSVARQHNVSEHTAKLIDEEVKRYIDEAYQTATKIITEKKENWIALAKALL